MPKPLLATKRDTKLTSVLPSSETEGSEQSSSAPSSSAPLSSLDFSTGSVPVEEAPEPVVEQEVEPDRDSDEEGELEDPTEAGTSKGLGTSPMGRQGS